MKMMTGPFVKNEINVTYEWHECFHVRVSASENSLYNPSVDYGLYTRKGCNGPYNTVLFELTMTMKTP